VAFKLRIEERPSIELRDWMYNDVLVKLWESRPEFEKYREEGEEIDRERVKIDGKTELPCVENISKGMMKINFIDWLKKSPAVPSYSSSQKKKQQSQPAAGEGGAGASEEDKDPDVIHRLKYFYPEALLLQPEYRYENKNSVFKRKDTEFMLEYLEMKEKEEAEKRASEEAELAAQMAAATGGKKDAKKADKKPPAKGAAPVEDKNIPQPITIEYPDVLADDDFLIYERDFLQGTVTP